MKIFQYIEHQEQHINDILDHDEKRVDTVGGIDAIHKIYDELPEFFIGSNNEKIMKNGTARFTGANHLFTNEDDHDLSHDKNDSGEINEEYELNPLNNSDSFDFPNIERREKGLSICDIPKPKVQRLKLATNENVEAEICLKNPSVSNSYDPSLAAIGNNQSSKNKEGLSMNQSLDFNSLRYAIQMSLN